jgi:hypothetical protein
VTQGVENIQRAELTEADEADANHQLSLIGVDLFLEIGALMAVSVSEVVCTECPHSSRLLVLVL